MADGSAIADGTDYLQAHQIHFILEHVVAQLVKTKPSDPLLYTIELLETIQLQEDAMHYQLKDTTSAKSLEYLRRQFKANAKHGYGPLSCIAASSCHPRVVVVAQNSCVRGQQMDTVHGPVAISSSHFSLSASPPPNLHQHCALYNSHSITVQSNLRYSQPWGWLIVKPAGTGKGAGATGAGGSTIYSDPCKSIFPPPPVKRINGFVQFAMMPLCRLLPKIRLCANPHNAQML